MNRIPNGGPSVREIEPREYARRRRAYRQFVSIRLARGADDAEGMLTAAQKERLLPKVVRNCIG